MLRRGATTAQSERMLDISSWTWLELRETVLQQDAWAGDVEAESKQSRWIGKLSLRPIHGSADCEKTLIRASKYSVGGTSVVHTDRGTVCLTTYNHVRQQVATVGMPRMRINGLGIAETRSGSACLGDKFEWRK